MARHKDKGTIVIGSGPNQRVVQESGGSIKPEFLTNKPSTKTKTKKETEDKKKKKFFFFNKKDDSDTKKSKQTFKSKFLLLILTVTIKKNRAKNNKYIDKNFVFFLKILFQHLNLIDIELCIHQ